MLKPITSRKIEGIRGTHEGVSSCCYQKIFIIYSLLGLQDLFLFVGVGQDMDRLVELSAFGLEGNIDQLREILTGRFVTFIHLKGFA